MFVLIFCKCLGLPQACSTSAINRLIWLLCNVFEFEIVVKTYLWVCQQCSAYMFVLIFCKCLGLPQACSTSAINRLIWLLCNVFEFEIVVKTYLFFLLKWSSDFLSGWLFILQCVSSFNRKFLEFQLYLRALCKLFFLLSLYYLIPCMLSNVSVLSVFLILRNICIKVFCLQNFLKFI